MPTTWHYHTMALVRACITNFRLGLTVLSQPFQRIYSSESRQSTHAPGVDRRKQFALTPGDERCA